MGLGLKSGLRRRTSAALACALAAFTPACGETGVDALAVWIDGNIDENGNRELQIYDRGERRSVLFQPVIPGSETQLLQMAVNGRARGVVLSGTRETLFVDLREGRRSGITAALDETRDLHPDFGTLRGGDAVYRELLSRTPTTARSVGLLPLSGRFGLEPSIVSTPGEPDGAASWHLLSATDAPVMFWVEERGDPIHAEGRVQAVVYPSAYNSPLPVPEPTVVAQGTLVGRGIDEGGTRETDDICPNRVCVSPSGRVLTTQADEPCALWRWDWTRASSPNIPLAPRRIVLPDECPSNTDPFLFATLSDDLVVMDDDQRILLFDLSNNTMRSAPKIGTELADVRLADRGKAILYISPAGQVVRVDEFGARLVSTEQSFCTIADSTAVSPSGNWVVMSCNGQAPNGLPDGLIMRVSALGLEQFAGISMRPVAVDDEGNAMLYSFDSDDSSVEPRGLFILGGDGTLARTDDLEPGPAPVAIPSEENGRVGGRFFHAVGIPRNE